MTTISTQVRPENPAPNGAGLVAPVVEPANDSLAELPKEAQIDRRRVERRKQGKSGRDSLFLRAMAVFLILDVVLSFTGPIPFDKFDFPYKGWSWWTFNELRDSTQSENVALMGSSLMITATNYCDSYTLKKPLNLVSYHSAQYFDSLLKAKVGGEFKTYNLAAPGLMPSDAYMTLLAMLRTSHRPDVIVYGLAPRDFYDSSLASPMDTEPFKFLRRLVNLEGTLNAMFRSPWSKLNWLLEENVYLYGNSVDFQLMCARGAERLVDAILPVSESVKPYTYWQRTALLPDYKPAEIHPEAIVIYPEDPLHPPALKDDTAQYKERYKNPDPRTFRTQLYFLNKIAEVCQREKIELLLVNMPITEGNIKILGMQRYLEFIHTLYRFSQEHNVPTFDLTDFKHFQPGSNYHDSVHLNASGGKKFFDKLVDTISKTPRIRAAFELAGQKLHKQKSLVSEPTPTLFNINLQ